MIELSMKIYDISWPISMQSTAYKDKKTVHFEPLKSWNVDAARETVLTMNAHTGTHIDAPSHFLANGTTIDQLKLQQVIGDCKVFDLSMIAECIMPEHIKSFDIVAGDIVLFKTANSALAVDAKFDPNFIYLSVAAAHYLVEKKVKTVGIDYLGIERNQPGHETHTELFNNGVTIIEGLRLKEVRQSSYFLCCLPLYTIGIEAAPARAILIEQI
jgi:arylformamidase